MFGNLSIVTKMTLSQAVSLPPCMYTGLNAAVEAAAHLLLYVHAGELMFRPGNSPRPHLAAQPSAKMPNCCRKCGTRPPVPLAANIRRCHRSCTERCAPSTGTGAPLHRLSLLICHHASGTCMAHAWCRQLHLAVIKREPLACSMRTLARATTKQCSCTYSHANVGITMRAGSSSDACMASTAAAQTARCCWRSTS